MATQPNRGVQTRTERLNFRELLPVNCPRHPFALRGGAPSDALGVLWLDSAGVDSYPRFAYLNRARAEALFTELYRMLHPGDHPAWQHQSAAERAAHRLRQVDRAGEASGA